MQVKQCLFLDLDKTVRRSKNNPNGFIISPDDIELMPNIKNIVSKYKESGYLIFGVSNQGGVAHGFKTIEQNHEEIKQTQKLMSGLFDAIECAFCMEDGKEPFNKRSLLRKPNIGMIAVCEVKALAYGFIIDYENSLFVGDSPEDQQCAQNANIRFEWVDDFLKRPHEFYIG